MEDPYRIRGQQLFKWSRPTFYQWLFNSCDWNHERNFTCTGESIVTPVSLTLAKASLDCSSLFNTLAETAFKRLGDSSFYRVVWFTRESLWSCGSYTSKFWNRLLIPILGSVSFFFLANGKDGNIAMTCHVPSSNACTNVDHSPSTH